jgi:uncharacterized protein
MQKYFFGLILALFMRFSSLFAQSAEDVKAMEKLMHVQSVSEPQFEIQGKGIEGAVSSGLFYFYKKFISSQDGSNCMFYPSCSEYAVQALRKEGMILGMMDAFDRLSRCNGLSGELYHKHPKYNLYYDPVD